ncbi:MAG: DNA-processing protein DprA [Oscillospiraceae bacterium]|jgi:DNA processing protein|nr:DNA-processing protein DprA [Oscillospiraceae bacterium]
MTDEGLYWLWLQCALGISSSLRTREILDAFPLRGEGACAVSAARRIYEASDYERRISGAFTAPQLNKLSSVSVAEAEKIAEECKRHGLHILTPQNPCMPSRLLQIPNHPLVLYVDGSLDCFEKRLAVALVGTRRADRKSVDIAGRLSASLARAGCVVVSGGALGIDSAAHRGALAAKGMTVAVLGCGHACSYLPENRLMREEIAKHGAVLSEFPPAALPLAQNFPIRNRIISGLSVGCVVVEAGERSGSLITAECAAEQGRDVFAVPGDVFGSTYTGANKLIKDGAKPVFSAMDILEEYEQLFPELLDIRTVERDLKRPGVAPETVAVKASTAQRKPSARKTAAGKRVAAAPAAEVPPAVLRPEGLEGKLLELLAQGALHVDALCKQSGQRLGLVFAALTNLEMDGFVRQMPGKLFESMKTGEEQT